MDCKTNNPAFEIFCNIATEFAPCMNDYLYVFDIVNDTYFITEGALSRFALNSNIFTHVNEVLRTIVHEDDFDMLSEDLAEMIQGLKDEHNLQYRWLGIDGSPIWINCRGRVIRSSDGTTLMMIGCINEIGNRQKADNVSGLLSETSLREHLTNLFPSIEDAMFLRIGIDDFKMINERHGSDYGNFVLRSVADCIKSCLSDKQHVYRLMSDEFMVLDLAGSDYTKINHLYHRIRSAVDEVVAAEQYKAIYTISAGLVSLRDISDGDFKDSAEAMKLSEFALTEAKNRGKNQLYHYKPEDYTTFLRTRYIRSCIRQSISNNYAGFDLHFQPIIMSNSESLYAAETLLRYRTPAGENIAPFELIPILEESGLIIPVGKWILRNSLLMCKKCREVYPDFVISINFSYIQLLKSPLYEDILEALESVGLPPSSLIVELTESGHLENSIAVQNVWKKLRKLGVNIALDDFGTGYSNLINIGNLKPNLVKVDRSFTLKALNNDYEREIMLHVIRMVHSIGLNLVVEGIETKEELIQITAMNPDFIQGYYYSKPCPAQDFSEKYLQ